MFFLNVRLQQSDRQQDTVVLPTNGVQGYALKLDVQVCFANGRCAQAAVLRLQCNYQSRKDCHRM